MARISFAAATLVALAAATAYAQQPARDRVSADLHVSVTVVRSCSISTRESSTVSVSCVKGAAPRQIVAAPAAGPASPQRQASAPVVLINF